MKLGKNDIYHFLSRGHFMNVNLYSEDFKDYFVDKGGETTYGFGTGLYVDEERKRFKKSARGLVIDEYSGIKIYENQTFESICSDGIYFNTIFENDDFKFRIDVVVVTSGIKTIIDFKNTTEWKEELLVRYFTMMNIFREDAYSYNFRYVIYSRSSQKGMVGSKFLDDLTLMGKTSVPFNLLWKEKKHFNYLNHNSEFFKKNGTLKLKFKNFMIDKDEWFANNFSDIVTNTKQAKEELSDSLGLAIDQGKPENKMVSIDQKISILFSDKKFAPKTNISKNEFNEYLEYLNIFKGKEIIFFDFETINPKITLFDGYPNKGSGVPVQTSIYKSSIDDLVNFEKLPSVIYDVFNLKGVETFFPTIEALWKEDSIYVSHSNHEERILNVIFNHPDTPDDVKEKIEYINENTFDTEKLFKKINTEKSSSIKIIEKYLKTQEGIYDIFNLTDYSALEIKNGFQAMDIFLKMQLLGDTKPYRLKDVRDFLEVYCDQDVRMMIALLYWWKEIWLKNVKIND